MAEFLETQIALYGSRSPALFERYSDLSALFAGKKWFEIADSLEEIVEDERCWFDQNVLDLFLNFVAKFENKLNALKFVLLFTRVVRKQQGVPPEEKIRLVESLLAKSFLTEEARIVARLNVCQLLVSSIPPSPAPTSSTSNTASALDRAKTIIDDVRPNLGALAEVSADDDNTNEMFACFHETESMYYKRMGPPSEFYRSALAYLSFAGLLVEAKKRHRARREAEERSKAAASSSGASSSSSPHEGGEEGEEIEESEMRSGKRALPTTTTSSSSGVEDERFRRLRAEMARDVCVAAIVADDVYNFGEVLSQDVIRTDLVASPENAWLLSVLTAFHEGDVEGFNVVLAKNRSSFEKDPTLSASLPVMKQKIALLSLMRVVFERDPTARDIPFAEVARAARLPLEEVEWLVMRAFSKGLLRGKMDQTTQTLHVSWLQPRVLDNDQLLVLDRKVLDWVTRVETTLKFEAAAPELFQSS